MAAAAVATAAPVAIAACPTFTRRGRKKRDTANISLKIPRTKNKNKQQLAVVSALIMPVGVLIFFSFLLSNATTSQLACSAAPLAAVLIVSTLRTLRRG